MTVVTEYPDAAIPRTAAWIVDGVYRALDVTDALLGHLGIPYSLVAGTLLGAVRHRGIIPWDNDGDLAIRKQDVALLQAQAASFLHPRGFGWCEYESSVMRIFPLDGRRTGYLFRFPFVDVFPMSRIDGRWKYDLLQYRRGWPPAYLDSDSFDNLRRCEFGALRLSSVSEEASLDYVKRVYGQDWAKPKPRNYRPPQVPRGLAARLPPALLASPSTAPREAPAAGPSQVVSLDVDEVDDGLVIYQRRPERLHYLNNTAALLYVMSTGAMSVIEMALALEQAFDLTTTPLAETTGCIDRLLGLGVLRVHDDLTGERPAARRHGYLRGLVSAGFNTPAERTFSHATVRANRSRTAPARATGSVARGEEVVLGLTGFGVGVCVSDTSALAIADRVAAIMPADMIGPVDDDVQLEYVVEPGNRGGVVIRVEGQEPRTFVGASEAVAWLRMDIDEVVAFRATEAMFVHAGVVGWRGRAILVPGRSGTGKTSLVAELVRHGADYYSDDYAPIDADGHVRSYARAPSVKGDPSPTRTIEPAVGVQARPPLPIALVVATSFQADARWQPAVVDGAAAMLRVLDNVIMAREDPRRALATAKAIAVGSITLSGSRPDAGEIAADLLARVDEAVDGEARADGPRERTRERSSSGTQAAVAQRMRVDTWTGEIVRAFAGAGVRPILLKGPATVRWLYPDDPFLRSYCDADLLVAPGDRAAARQILAARGFIVQGHPRLRRDGHHALNFTRAGDNAQVDLHHTLHGMDDVPAERVWEAARRDAGSMVVGGSEVAVLGHTMRLLHVALHLGASEGPGDRAWTDLTRAFEVSTSDEWESALDLARELGVAHELAARLRRRDEAAWLLERLGPQPRAMRYSLAAAVGTGRVPQTVLSIDRLLAADGVRAKASYAVAKFAVSTDELSPPAARVLARSGSLQLARCAHATTIAARLPGALAAWRRERRGDPPPTGA